MLLTFSRFYLLTERNLLAVGPTEVQWTVKDLDILVQVTQSGNWTAAPLNFEFQIGSVVTPFVCSGAK